MDMLSSQYCSSVTTQNSQSQDEVQLPMNALQLIANAITSCGSPTPTTIDIAAYIHDNFSTYQDYRVETLTTLVQHHLNAHAHVYFLPVRIPGQPHLASNMASCRWILNRQNVMKSDGPKRRFHPYIHKRYTSTPGPSSSDLCKSAGTHYGNGQLPPPGRTAPCYGDSVPGGNGGFSAGCVHTVPLPGTNFPSPPPPFPLASS